MKSIFACVALALVARVALAQEFEVVSVRPNHSDSRRSSMHSDRGLLTATNASLRSLIIAAYDLKDYQLEGPDWLRLEHFDIAAKFPEALPKNRDAYNAAIHAMMQKMLVERFGLVTHRTSRESPVYGLIVSKSGTKLKAAADPDSHSQDNSDRHYKGAGVSMASFADFLSRRLDLPVLDMTGLKGFYDMTLDWSPDPPPSIHPAPDRPIADRGSGPALPEALQEQLGLSLAHRRAPIEITVVDRVQRTPTEN